MPRIACNPDAPLGPWTAANPCRICAEARKVRERPSLIRRLIRIPSKPDPSPPPSVCCECGSAGSETITFNEPNWNPDTSAERCVEEPVGPTDETRDDDVFGQPTPIGRPMRTWARFHPLEDDPIFAAPDAHELAWAKAIAKAHRPERGASDVLGTLLRLADPFMPSRRPTLPLAYQERRRRSQKRWHLATKLRRIRNGIKTRLRPYVTLAPNVLDSIIEQDKPDET